jgi:hypothetical protein
MQNISFYPCNKPSWNDAQRDSAIEKFREHFLNQLQEKITTVTPHDATAPYHSVSFSVRITKSFRESHELDFGIMPAKLYTVAQKEFPTMMEPFREFGVENYGAHYYNQFYVNAAQYVYSVGLKKPADWYQKINLHVLFSTEDRKVQAFYFTRVYDTIKGNFNEFVVATTCYRWFDVFRPQKLRFDPEGKDKVSYSNELHQQLYEFIKSLQLPNFVMLALQWSTEKTDQGIKITINENNIQAFPIETTYHMHKYDVVSTTGGFVRLQGLIDGILDTGCFFVDGENICTVFLSSEASRAQSKQPLDQIFFPDPTPEEIITETEPEAKVDE